MKITDIKEMDIQDNSFISELLLVPHANKVNTNRGVMWCNHFSQAPVLANEDGGEFPLISSRFENQVGQYSSGYKYADDNYLVVKKFQRNKYHYTLLIQNEQGYYDILERNEEQWFTERYGCKFNNYMDNYKENDWIQKDDLLYANTSYDEDMNFCYGRNLRTIFMAYKDLTHEDAVVMSESAAKKLGYYSIAKPIININTNDLLLDSYGDGTNYKAFPDIGEYIEDQELVKRRRIVYDKILTSLKDLNEYLEGDDVFYCEGKVIDIKIYCNKDVDSLRDLPYYNQIVKYLDEDYIYYNDIINTLSSIVEKNTEYCSNDLIRFYNDAKRRMDEGNYFTYQSNKFDNIMIEFTIMKLKPSVKGIKITGRYGRRCLFFI